LVQLRRRKWNWLGHTLRKSGDSIAKQALQWTTQGHRGRGQPKNTWRRELQNEMWTAGFRYSWRKMEEAELDGDELSVAYAPLGVTKHKSRVRVSRIDEAADWRCGTAGNREDCLSKIHVAR